MKEKIIQKEFKGIGIKDSHKFVKNVIISAKKQLKKHLQPVIPPPSWKPVNPKNTDYQLPEQTGLVNIKLVDLKGNDINWEMINLELLSDLEKDEIETKQLLRDI